VKKFRPIVSCAALLLTCSLGFLCISGCKEAAKSDEYRFVEYLKIEGECYEDHVKRPAKYTGSLVHWYNSTKAIHSRYGSVHQWESIKPEKLLESIQEPYTYKPPFTVSFQGLKEEEIAGDMLRLKGISEHLGKAENTEGPRYWATCEMKVLERLDHIPRPEPRDMSLDRAGKQ
jgi:hypothetical protein